MKLVLTFSLFPDVKWTKRSRILLPKSHRKYTRLRWNPKPHSKSRVRSLILESKSCCYLVLWSLAIQNVAHVSVISLSIESLIKCRASDPNLDPVSWSLRFSKISWSQQTSGSTALERFRTLIIL